MKLNSTKNQLINATTWATTWAATAAATWASAWADYCQRPARIRRTLACALPVHGNLFNVEPKFLANGGEIER